MTRLILLGVAALACTSPRPDIDPVAAPALRNATIHRSASCPDGDLAARGLGHLEVAFRSADEPTRTIDAIVTTRFEDEKTTKRLVSEMGGHDVVGHRSATADAGSGDDHDLSS